MTTITAKQNALESFSSATDWMASFLDFQISKLEEHSEDVPVGMDAKYRRPARTQYGTNGTQP